MTMNHAVGDETTFAELTGTMATRERPILTDMALPSLPFENAAEAMIAAEHERDHLLHRFHVFGGVSFVAASAIAVLRPNGVYAGWMIACLLFAIGTAFLARILGDRRFVQVIERAARAQGLSKERARRAAHAMHTASLRGESHPLG